MIAFSTLPLGEGEGVLGMIGKEQQYFFVAVTQVIQEALANSMTDDQLILGTTRFWWIKSYSR